MTTDLASRDKKLAAKMERLAGWVEKFATLQA